MIRPVAHKVLNVSTTTGDSMWAFFGIGHRYVSAYIANPSTKAFVNSIVVGAGASTVLHTVLASATSTGANMTRTSTGGVVFDKARVAVSSNVTTGGVTAWLVAAH